MSLTKRLVKGSALTAVEHDANLDFFVGELADKCDDDDARLSNARTPTAHIQAISTVTGLQDALDAKATASALSALSDEVDGKADDDDARLTDARAIANGSYGDFDVDAGTATIDRTPRDAVKIFVADDDGLVGTIDVVDADADEDDFPRYNGDGTTRGVPAASTADVAAATDTENVVVSASLPGLWGATQVWVPAFAITPAVTSGAEAGVLETSSNKVCINYLGFDTAADEYGLIQIMFPGRWNGGTVTAKFVWMHPSTTSNFSVTWGIQGLSLADDDATDASWGTGIVVTDEGGTTNDAYISPATAAVTIASAAAGEAQFLRVYRDVDGNGTSTNDDLAVDARLIGVLLTFTSTALKDA